MEKLEKFESIIKKIKGAGIAVIALFLVMVLVILVNWFGILRKYYVQPKSLKASASYDIGSGQVSPDALAYLATNPNSELASNEKGTVVFQHARKAYTDNKHENKEGRKTLQKVYGLKHFSKTWYKEYIDKSKELQVGMPIPGTEETVTAEQVAQARHFGLILSIYTNSFRTAR